MNLSNRLRTGLLLLAVFAASFLFVFFPILLTQSAYSTPSNYILMHQGMDLTLGPPPNATGIPLDTTITVDALASAALNDLQLNPPVPIARVYSESTGPLTYVTTFYPAQVLKPATTYTVYVTILGAPVSWSFTTTSEPFSPGTSFILASNAAWISLSGAAVATSIVGFALWFRRRKLDATVETRA